MAARYKTISVCMGAHAFCGYNEEELAKHAKEALAHKLGEKLVESGIAEFKMGINPGDSPESIRYRYSFSLTLKAKKDDTSK